MHGPGKRELPRHQLGPRIRPRLALLPPGRPVLGQGAADPERLGRRLLQQPVLPYCGGPI